MTATATLAGIQSQNIYFFFTTCMKLNLIWQAWFTNSTLFYHIISTPSSLFHPSVLPLLHPSYPPCPSIHPCSLSLVYDIKLNGIKLNEKFDEKILYFPQKEIIQLQYFFITSSHHKHLLLLAGRTSLFHQNKESLSIYHPSLPLIHPFLCN